MVKCHKCGTGWTSKGLPLCPICGTKVEEPGPAVKAASAAERSPVTSSPEKPSLATLSPKLEAPAPPPRVRLKKVEPAPFVPTLPDPEPAPTPAPPPKIQIQKVAPVPAEPLVRELVPAAEPPSPRADIDRFVHSVVLRESAPKPEALPEAPKSTVQDFERLELSDPSAISLPVIRELRTSSRPLSGPLILGALAYVGVFLLPLTVAFESSRVLGVLGFCLTAFFAPFAPIAWLAGLAAEKRRREQGLRPENPVALGRLLGQWATLLLVSEVTLALVGIAALRLAGRFPFSFWAPFY
jgi:hypothetical protein